MICSSIYRAVLYTINNRFERTDAKSKGDKFCTYVPQLVTGVIRVVNIVPFVFVIRLYDTRVKRRPCTSIHPPYARIDFLFQTEFLECIEILKVFPAPYCFRT